jgi:SHS2 domain-containing protein
MTTTATINPAILDVDAMIQKIDDKNTIETLFGNVFSANYDMTLQSSSVEEFETYNFEVYAKDSVERVSNRIAEETMIFKTEEVVNYGKEDFLSKRFFQLRKFGQNWFFDTLSVSSGIHAGGFIPVTICKIDDEFKVKFLKRVYGEGARITKSAEGRNFIKTDERFEIWTDM